MQFQKTRITACRLSVGRAAPSVFSCALPDERFCPFLGSRAVRATRLRGSESHNSLDRCLSSSTCRLCSRLERDFLHLNGTRLGGIEHRPLPARFDGGLTDRMSALGQKQTFAMHKPMSALHPKADVRT